jgi:hypothetical protein
MRFKNGYDPLYNQMLTGAIPGYLTAMDLTVRREKEKEEALASVANEVPLQVGDEKSGTVQTKSGQSATGKGEGTTGNGAETTARGEERAVKGQSTTVNGEEKTANGVTTTGSGETTQQSGTTGTQPSGAADLTGSGSSSLPSGVMNSFPKYSDVLMNNYYASKGIYDVPFGGEEEDVGYGPADLCMLSCITYYTFIIV